MEYSDNQLKALDLNRNIIITAGAGSGKTAVLVKKYLHILIYNPNLLVKNILAITFTEKAAAEMKDRIFKEINEQFQKDRTKQARLFEILNQFHEAQISTIHSFCSHLLRQFPVETQLKSEFTVLSDIQIDDLLNQVFKDFFYTRDFKDHKCQELILKTLHEYSIARLKKIFTIIYRKRAAIFEILNARQKLSPTDLLNQWKSIYITHNGTILESLYEKLQFWKKLKALTSIQMAEEVKEINRHKEIKINQEKYLAAEEDELSRIDALISIIQLLTKRDGSAFQKIPGGKDSWGTEGVNLFKELSRMVAEYSQDLIFGSFELEEEYSEILMGLNCLLLEFLNYMEESKTKLNVIDFDDLQIHILRILQNYPEIRAQIRKAYPFILVDEFQDTDLLQTHILELLSHDHHGNLDNNRLFIVGDPKQSIFAFRNADVSYFKEYVTEFSRQGSDKSPLYIAGLRKTIKSNTTERSGIISLSENFRSTESLISFFNRTFETLFQKSSSYDVDYQPLVPTIFLPSEKESRVQVDLFIDEIKGDFNFIEIQAHHVVKQIKMVVASENFKKIEPSNSGIHFSKIGFGDIAILLRARTHMNVIEQAFRDHSIPYQTYKGAGFFQKQEIQDIYYILRCLANLDDDFSLLTTLRSNFIGLSDVTLLYISQIQGQNYWQKLQDFRKFLTGAKAAGEIFKEPFLKHAENTTLPIDISPAEKQAIEFVIDRYKSWSDLASHSKFSQLVDSIIEELNVRPLLKAQMDGDQKLANVNKLVQHIYDFESTSSTLMSDLLDNLHRLINDETKETEAVITAEEDKVKILTYHSAKGMEFPVVILPLLERRFRYSQDVLYHKNFGFAVDLDQSVREENKKPFIYQFLQQQDHKMVQAEEKRLLYVAATRAKDYLFLAGSFKKNSHSFNLNYLNWILESHNILPEKILDSGSSESSYGDLEFNLRLHIIGEDYQYPDADSKKGKSSDLKGKIKDVKILDYQKPYPEKPNLQVYSVTQLMLYREDKARYFHHFYLNSGELLPPSIELEFQDEPGGALWGTVVHQLLENFHLRDPKEDELKIQQILMALHLPEKKVKLGFTNKLNDIMEKFRKSELSQKISRSINHSEFAIDLRIGDFILRGIFDSLWKNQLGNWEVIDYKTNKIKSGDIDRVAKKYSFQMHAYALLLSAFAPQQAIFPISIFFLEPMEVYRKDYTLIDIESTRTEISQILNNIFTHEKSLFRTRLIEV